MNEWQTPVMFTRIARNILGLNVADPTRASAQYTTTFKPIGPVIWCTAPVGQQEEVSKHLMYQFQGGMVEQALLLVESKTSTEWFQNLMYNHPVCFLRYRVKFYDDLGTISPVVRNTMVYMGRREAFLSMFLGRWVRS